MDMLLLFGREGPTAEMLTIPLATGYLPESFDHAPGPLLQAPITVVSSNRPLTAI
jgi:hypothetical protein